MSIKCAVLAIGSELLEGSVTDTNSGFIGGILSRMGIRPDITVLVPDNMDLLVDTIKDLTNKYPLVITTGGLGPTFDDITAECIADAAGIKTILNEEAFNHMKARLESLNVTVGDNHKRQAILPENCRLFMNYCGTAMGFGVSVGTSYTISMPGVPFEMTEMFEKSVIPFIKEKFPIESIIHKELHFGCLPESDVDKVIMDIGIPSNVTCIINAGKSEIVVKLRSGDEKALTSFAEQIVAAFPDNFIGYDNATPANGLSRLLIDKNMTLATAESCTGGLIGKMITDISGVSQIFLGGVISYSNQVKISQLGVKEETLAKYGAVSNDTCKEMAEGALKTFQSDCAISVTGVAGPNGGSDEKPVGTVYIGVATKGKTVVKKYNFYGSRESVRIRSANVAMFIMIQLLRGNI